MGKDLDLDDVSYDHPYAKAELAELRDRIRTLEEELTEQHDAAEDRLADVLKEVEKKIWERFHYIINGRGLLIPRIAVKAAVDDVVKLLRAIVREEG